jgi:hypothetical protein
MSECDLKKEVPGRIYSFNSIGDFEFHIKELLFELLLT